MHSLVPALLALTSFTGLASGQFWPTVTTTTNMGTWSTYNITNLTNGVGLSAMHVAATHSGTWQEMWLSNSIVTGWIQFDLGSIQPLSTIAVWNYNSSIGTTRGVQTMNVSTSLDGMFFTPLPQQLVPQGTTQPLPPHLIPVNNFPARYVKFDVLQNYGNTYTGLSEVQFVVPGSCRGTVARSGTGCLDAGSTRNTMTYSGCPDLGTTLSLELNTSASARGPLYLIFGVSDQSWNSVLLPLNLGPINAPGCNAYVGHSLVLGAPPQANGRSTVPLPIPNTPQLFGGIVFTQFFHLDAAANPLGLVTSDYLKLTVR